MKLLFAVAAMLPAIAWAYSRQVDDAQLAAVEPDTPLPPDQLPDPSFLETIGIMSMSSTRGERNNNPGNIRKSDSAWMGKVAGTDTAFETFADPLSGIRALAKLLRNYQLNLGLRTIRQIIIKYAPPSENNTEAYIRAVAADVGVSPDAEINLLDDARLEQLTAAVIRHENGRNIYSQADIAAAVRLV